MCLILLAWKVHPHYPLVVAANRDEFFARPTASADFWSDAPHVLAGRDLQGGGTWLGVTRAGRFAALTNYRDPQRVRTDAPSRGELVARFLRGSDTPKAFAVWLETAASACNGFNLIYGDTKELHYFSNCGDHPRRLEAGIYGLSNHLLDTPWPKVAKGKSSLAHAVQALPDDAPLIAMLRDDTPAADEELPRTGVSLEWERLLSAAFVRSPAYGTRSSTVVVMAADGLLRFDEIGFDAAVHDVSRRKFSLQTTPEEDRTAL